MLDLDTLLRDLPPRPDPAQLVAGFVPPPRFAAKRFEDYRPDPRHPSQAEAVRRLREVARELNEGAMGGFGGMVKRVFGRSRNAGGGVYLDGGFGVGKTHLLAALWHQAPQPSAYLSFDELVYTIGLLGVEGTRAAFRGRHLVAVDEWELDDPGNLKMALAFLRGALADGVRIAATSNTVPDELGHGRFDQKSFRAEIEELAAAFEVLEISGDDYRHRHFQADPGRAYFLDAAAMAEAVSRADERTLVTDFHPLMTALGEVHPIRYAAIAERIGTLLVWDLEPFTHPFDALRWVHLVDKLYEDSVALAATSHAALGELFPQSFLQGAFGKKFSRCLSRMEEMLAERIRPG